VGVGKSKERGDGKIQGGETGGRRGDEGKREIPLYHKRLKETGQAPDGTIKDSIAGKICRSGRGPGDFGQEFGSRWKEKARH